MGLGAMMPNHIPTLLHTPLCGIFNHFSDLLKIRIQFNFFNQFFDEKDPSQSSISLRVKSY